jgi:hypothetical protein
MECSIEMIENLKHIKNPLTLISIFAGAAELGGAAVLPFITEQNQELYIKFLIVFPIYTVTLFFATLNFNHRTLYAPSDYKDEKNFVDQFGKATPEELARKLAEETSEVQADTQKYQSAQPSSEDLETSDDSDKGNKPETPQTPPKPASSEVPETNGSNNGSTTAPARPTNVFGLEGQPEPIKNNEAVRQEVDEAHFKDLKLPKLSKLDPKFIDLMEPYEVEHRKLMANVALTEKLAVSKLSKALNLHFKEDVSFQPSGSSIKYVFDAADYSNSEVQVVEVKLFTNRFDPKRFLKTLENAHNLNRSFTTKGKFTLHLVVVLESVTISPGRIRERMKEITNEYNFNIVVHITTTADLQSDGGIFY